MKKCTLCIDRIYNETLDAADRVPACVATCPASARHFGDLGDPESEVSRLVAERGGYDLMPEMGYAPTNKYLPPRRRDERAAAPRNCRMPRRRAGSSAGSIGCCPAELVHPAAVDHRLHHALGRGLRAPVLARPRRGGGLLPADRGFGAAALGARARRGQRAGCVSLGLPSRPARARLARVLAMAQLVAVARRRRVARDLRCRRCSSPGAGSCAATTGGLWAACGARTAAGAAATVVCTAYIYRSLKPIAHWSNAWVPANFLALAAMTGRAVARGAAPRSSASATRGARGSRSPRSSSRGALKLGYWRHIDGAPGAARPKARPGSARSAGCGSSRRRTRRRIIC